MENGFTGFHKIFAFTFRQHIKSKGYKKITWVLGILCFLLPAVIMASIEFFGDDSGQEAGITESSLAQVYVADISGTEPVDMSFLNQVGDSLYSSLQYIDCGESVDKALEQAGNSQDSLVMVIERDETDYQLHIILPDGSALTEKEAQAYGDFAEQYFTAVLVTKAKMSDAQMAEWVAGMTEEAPEEESSEERSSEDIAKEIFSMLLPYLNIMVLYFLILAYGQGVSNSVVMEKTSKLMDTFLVSVKPEAMVLGKVLAIAIAGMLQFTIWIAALVLGFAAGTLAVKAINPATDMAIIQLFESFSEVSGVFSATGILLAILMIFAGFLLYCSLSAIGGAIAGKAEDLSSTNMLFVMALLISFFCTLYAGGMDGMSSTATWLNWVPFTAILVTPSRLLLGTVSILQGLLSLGIVLLAALLIMWLAGRIYKMMSLYSGKLPSLKQVFGMLMK